MAGVINAETDEVSYFSYDAWGNPRDNEDWTSKVSSELFADRGFTGHEHLQEFGLIDMNGRVYDPILGRFLSPDPYVQMPGYANNFNRYAYCLNNPLVYIDPNGEIIFTIIGALLAPVTGGASLALGIAMDVGGAINLGTKALQGKIHNVVDGLAAYGIGAAAGALGYATGGTAFMAAGGAAGGAGGFLAGLAGGAIGSGFSMPVLSMGNTIYFGDPMMTPGQYALGIIGGGLLGGSIQGISALANGRTFWNGNLKGSGLSKIYVPSLKLDDTPNELKIERLKIEKLKYELGPMPEESKIYYLENAKSAIKYSDGVPSKIVRDANFRNNLIFNSGINPGDAANAHHVFPLKYALDFHKAGINSNGYGAWWGPGHINNSSSYNQAWGNFFRANQAPSQSDIFKEAIRLKLLFGY